MRPPTFKLLLTLTLCACLFPDAILRADWDPHNLQTVFAGVSEVRTATRCERLVLYVSQSTSNGATETHLEYFVIDECGTRQTLASGFALVPNNAFSFGSQRRSLRLQTTAPAGATGPTGVIDVSWTLTDVESWSSTGTWRNQVGNLLTLGRRTDDQRSAQVNGTIVGYNVSGTGQFGWTTMLANSRER